MGEKQKGIIEKLGLLEPVTVKYNIDGTRVYSIVEQRNEMLEALVEIVSMVEKGISIDVINPPLYELLQKATGKTWEEIKAML